MSFYDYKKAVLIPAISLIMGGCINSSDEYLRHAKMQAEKLKENLNESPARFIKCHLTNQKMAGGLDIYFSDDNYIGYTLEIGKFQPLTDIMNGDYTIIYATDRDKDTIVDVITLFREKSVNDSIALDLANIRTLSGIERKLLEGH